MKKTLIALAAVAATGASFAQVTMSGNFGMSWQQSPTIAMISGTNTPVANGQHVQGLGTTDGEIYITATESLGAGWAATARGGWTMRGRGTPVLDRDATVSLTTPAGVFTTGAVRSCGAMYAQLSGVVSGPTYSSNESSNYIPLGKCSMIDMASFTTKVDKFTLTGLYGEYEKRVADTSTTLTTAPGAASATFVPQTAAQTDGGNGLGLTFTALAAEYGDGPLTLGMDWTHFSAAYVGNVFPLTGTVIGAAYVPFDGLDRYRFYGKYDAGFAKFAAGYQKIGLNGADQYVASVTVPVGNMTLALDYMGKDAQTASSGSLAADAAANSISGTRNGDKASSAVGVGMNYNFSKTTVLNMSYITYTDAGANTKLAPGSVTVAGSTVAQLDTEYRIRLQKSF